MTTGISIHEITEFRHQLDVNTFFRVRMKDRGLTQTELAKALGNTSKGSITQLFRGRARFSRSKHFNTICDLLDVTPEQREAIVSAEKRNSRKRLRPVETQEPL